MSASVRRCSAAGQASSGNVRRIGRCVRTTEDERMAGAIHKMAVYLGLVEDDRPYDDGYDGYEEEYADYDEEAEARGEVTVPPSRAAHAAEGLPDTPARFGAAPQPTDLTRIT